MLLRDTTYKPTRGSKGWTPIASTSYLYHFIIYSLNHLFSICLVFYIYIYIYSRRQLYAYRFAAYFAFLHRFVSVLIF